jgi:hypothetical protein
VPSFHTVSPSAPSGWRSERSEVPPTDITYCWAPGSSTERYGATGVPDENGVFAQSSEPSSPAEAKTV